jgi:hypothetical protein
MFSSNILDVAAGLVFVFLLLSLISSAANELIETFLRKRAAFLEKGIKEMIGGKDQVTLDFMQKIYDHGLINSLYVGTYLNPKKILPTYIPARNFALAVLDLWKSSDKSGKNLPPNVQKALGAFEKVAEEKARTAQDRAEILQKEVESWFNSSMDRVSGWYKRRSQIFVLVLAVLITVLVNADCIQIAKRLSTDANLRQAAARLAEKQTAPASGGQSAQATVAQMKQNLTDLDGIGLPLGWSPRPHSLADVGDAFLNHWVGWLITVLAISLGAPFWFDVLNKIIVVRSTVKPSEKSGPEASKDPTATQNPMVLTVQAASPAAPAAPGPGGANPAAQPDAGAEGAPAAEVDADEGGEANAGAMPPPAP